MGTEALMGERLTRDVACGQCGRPLLEDGEMVRGLRWGEGEPVFCADEQDCKRAWWMERQQEMRKGRMELAGRCESRAAVLDRSLDHETVELLIEAAEALRR